MPNAYPIVSLFVMFHHKFDELYKIITLKGVYL